ncbi:MAG: hypothetical protein ABIS50_22735 [Luteolibacter sp.]|uniref:hypothetical protein n=1 Tax=Luteolibacter sp. TaxID=1962973 RepID=UPI003263A78B
MKTLALFLAAGLCGLSNLRAAEPAKPAVTLTVKQQILDTDHDLRGKQGSSRQKTLTLRVEIVNATSALVAESELAGDALVTRAGDANEKVVKESLGTMKVPAMKPNERLTLELGKIELREIEWRNRKFEETLEEWQVTCSQGTVKIGKAVSSDHYATLLKEVVPPAKKKGPVNPKPRKVPKP